MLFHYCSNIWVLTVTERQANGWRINHMRLADYGPEKAGVGGSTPSRGTNRFAADIFTH
jgi:hypothetical protein